MLSGGIVNGLQRHVTVFALSVDERELLLGVLEEAERPSLAELRRVLAEDPGPLKQTSSRTQPTALNLDDTN